MSSSEESAPLAIPRNLNVFEELQQLCDIFLDDAMGVTWDTYRLEQKFQLEIKVRYAMYPESVKVDANGENFVVQPRPPEEIENDPKERAKWESQVASRNENLLHVVEKIWDQIKHTKSCLRMSIIYIALVDAKYDQPQSAPQPFLLRPLFRTMKCTDVSSGDTRNKCMVFVDEFGFVYPNWKDFKECTLYPDCTIVAPEVGVFMRDNQGNVLLEHFKAPKTREMIDQESTMNMAMTIGGLGSAAVLGAGAFFPLTAPLVWGAVGVGTLVGLVTGSKSASELANRSRHEQSLSLWNKESRAHWLAVTGVLVGFAASGATSVLRSAATAGNVSRGLTYTCNTLSGVSLGINGVSVVNGGVDLYQSDRPATWAEIAQISSSLFLFTHSLYNFQTANTIVRETQTQHLADYKTTLSKNGQKRFQNKLNGRARENGARGMGDTIRNLNTAEHYNNNFKGTANYANTTSFTGNQNMVETLSGTFLRYAPASAQNLAAVYTMIRSVTKEDIWDLLKGIAETLMDRFRQMQGLRIEDVINDIFNVVRKHAKSRGVNISELLSTFRGTFETIPRVVIDFFQQLFPQPGPVVCEVCQGRKYNV